MHSCKRVLFAKHGSYDKNNSSINSEVEKVLSVINDCVTKGLLWELTVLDLNEKLEYVYFFYSFPDVQTRFQEFNYLLFFLFSHDESLEVLLVFCLQYLVIFSSCCSFVYPRS